MVSIVSLWTNTANKQRQITELWASNKQINGVVERPWQLASCWVVNSKVALPYGSYDEVYDVMLRWCDGKITRLVTI